MQPATVDQRLDAALSRLRLIGASGVRQDVNEYIDPEAVNRHTRACLRSFEPRHEHKIAGVAYLLSLWFREDSDA